MTAGTAAPPHAAATGRIAAPLPESSPVRNSRLISRPTTRKNTAMSPSLIAWATVVSTRQAPSPKRSGRWVVCAYASFHGEFARTIAAIAAARRRIPEKASDRRKLLRKGEGRIVGPSRTTGVYRWPSALLLEEKGRAEEAARPVSPSKRLFFFVSLQTSSWILTSFVSRRNRPPTTTVMTETMIGYQRPW